MNLSTGIEHLNVEGIDVQISTYIERGGLSARHYHDHTNMVFLLAGGCIEKRKTTAFEREAADIAFLHAGEVHEMVLTRWPTQYISLEIEPHLFAQYGFSEEHLLKAMSMTPDAKFLMLKMYQELRFNDGFSVDSIQMLFLELASLTRMVNTKKKAPTWIHLVHDLLQDKWDQPVSLADLSTTTGVHPVTISKQFPLYFGCTLGNYRRKLKIERSLSLLKKSNHSLTETTYTCHFADQSHFIRNFRAFTGLLPSQYRAF